MERAHHFQRRSDIVPRAPIPGQWLAAEMKWHDSQPESAARPQPGTGTGRYYLTSFAKASIAFSLG